MSLKNEQRKTQTVFARISSEENQQLDFIANKNGVTRTGVIRTAIREYLEKNNQHPQALSNKITVDVKNLLISLGLKKEDVENLLNKLKE